MKKLSYLEMAKLALKKNQQGGKCLPDQAPKPDANPFKRGFDLLFDRLIGPARTWEKSALAAEIREAIETMDTAWVRRDLIAFQSALVEIHRLLTKAGCER